MGEGYGELWFRELPVGIVQVESVVVNQSCPAAPYTPRHGHFVQVELVVARTPIEELARIDPIAADAAAAPNLLTIAPYDFTTRAPGADLAAAHSDGYTSEVAYCLSAEPAPAASPSIGEATTFHFVLDSPHPTGTQPMAWATSSGLLTTSDPRRGDTDRRRPLHRVGSMSWQRPVVRRW